MKKNITIAIDGTAASGKGTLAKKLAKQISKDVIVVSESGINSREDILSSKEEGIHSFLIGEILMREQCPGKSLRVILGK